MAATIAVGFVGVYSIVIVLLAKDHSPALSWDEVDYVVAARAGLRANLLDSGAPTPKATIEFISAKAKGTPPKLPTAYDESKDLLLRRHYHPPLPAVLLSTTASARKEPVVRAVQTFGACVLILLVVAAYLLNSDKPSAAGAIAVFVLALPLSLSLFQTINNHGWQSLWLVLAAASLARPNPDSAIRVAALASAFIGSLLTLETAPLLLAGSMASVAVLGHWRSGMRMVLRGCLVAGLVTPLLWPGLWLHLSAIRIPALYVYRIWRGQEYGTLELAPMIKFLPLIILSIVSLALPLRRPSQSKAILPFLTCGALYCIALLPFALNSLYLYPGLVCVVPAIGLAFDRLPRAARIFALSVVIPSAGVAFPKGIMKGHSKADIEWLRKRLVEDERVALIDGGHIYRYYYGDSIPMKEITVAYSGAEITERTRGQYVPIPVEELTGSIIVIQRYRLEQLDISFQRWLDRSCEAVERPTIIYYDCGRADVE